MWELGVSDKVWGKVYREEKMAWLQGYTHDLEKAKHGVERLVLSLL